MEHQNGEDDAERDRDLLRNARALFFIYDLEEEFLIELNRAVSGLHPLARSIGEVFSRNVEAVISAVSLPCSMAMAHAHSSHWQRFVTAARIRSRKLCDSESANTTPEQRDEVAYEMARGQMREFTQSPSGIQQLINDGCLFLVQLSRQNDVRSGAQELLREGVVLTWGAFEVMARDAFVAYLNKHPWASTRILDSERTRKKFGGKSLSLERMRAYGFDLSNSMGDYLASAQDMSDISTIRETFGELFCKDDCLQRSLAQNALYQLNRRRSLLVHRRGVVDREYLCTTNDTCELGTSIAIDPPYLAQALRIVRDCGIQLLKTVSSAVTSAGGANSGLCQ